MNELKAWVTTVSISFLAWLTYQYPLVYVLDAAVYGGVALAIHGLLFRQ